MSNTHPVIAIYPGSFDPITRGHEDIARRTLRIADRLIVAVAHTASQTKTGLFTVEERVELIREVFAGDDRVEAAAFHGLLVDFARQKGARAVALSIVYPVDDPHMRNEISKLAQLLGPSTPILVGGRGAPSYRGFIEESGARYLPDIQSLRNELEAIRAGEREK